MMRMGDVKSGTPQVAQDIQPALARQSDVQQHGLVIVASGGSFGSDAVLHPVHGMALLGEPGEHCPSQVLIVFHE